MRHLNRAGFLSAGAAALLTGCGHGHAGSSMLPQTTAQSNQRAPAGLSPADPIPAHVLQFPIVGEARRFDGSVVPPGWDAMNGRTLPTASNRALAGILDMHAAKSMTFKIPAAPGWIIAITGTIPLNPHSFDALHRGANPNHGVSVASLTVSDAPLTMAKPAPVEKPLPTWYPGTLATSALLDAQRRAASEILHPASLHGTGAPHAL